MVTDSPTHDRVVDIPPVKLGNAMSEVYLAVTQWSAACNRLDRLQDPASAARAWSERDDAVVEVRNWIVVAEDAIPGADVWVQPIKGTKTGEYTSRIKHLLTRLRSDSICHGHGLPPTGRERDEFFARLEEIGRVQLELREHLDYSAVRPAVDAANHLSPIAHRLQAGDHTQAHDRRERLLVYLGQQDDYRCAVAAMPSDLLDADLLTVMDADGLIEFGRRNHCHAGQRLVIERGWDFVSITGPGKNPMGQYLREVLNWTDDDRIRPHVRLTAKGRVETSRLILRAHQEPAEHPEPKSALNGAGHVTWEVARDIAERYVKGRAGVFPGRNALANHAKCAPATMTKAIKRSTYLNARQATAKAAAPASKRLQSLSAIPDEELPEKLPQQSELRRLMAEQAAEVRRETRQHAAQKRRSR